MVDVTSMFGKVVTWLAVVGGKQGDNVCLQNTSISGLDDASAGEADDPKESGQAGRGCDGEMHFVRRRYGLLRQRMERY